MEVNENSSFLLDITLKDVNGNALSPVDEVVWWVGKPKSEIPIIPLQTVENPAANMQLVIPPEASICSSRKDEERFVVVRVKSGAEFQKHEWYTYTVKAQATIPYPEEEEQE